MALDDEQLKKAERIELGVKAEEFMTSDIGRYLMNRASREASGALLKLSSVDPDDSKTIRDLQTKIKRCDDLERWLDEAIQVGKSEYISLSDELMEDDSEQE